MNAKVLNQFPEWQIDRADRSFRFQIVEPDTYAPGLHGDIFNKALEVLMSRPHEPDVEGVPSQATEDEPRFDLLIFPEAFLAASDLITAIGTVFRYGISIGCVHVGLRPTDDGDQSHLFSRQQTIDLVDRLAALSGAVAEDFAAFRAWATTEIGGGHVNLACLFSIEAGQIRICLHPKSLRSKFEESPLTDSSMKEATAVTAVTLRPLDKKLKSVTLQPLICADALDATADTGLKGPLESLNGQIDGLTSTPPDHVDIVSVTTFTPQSYIRRNSNHYPAWHSEFTTSFLRNAKSRDRHHFALFVLANFAAMGGSPAGLSGAFIPIDSRARYPDYLSVSRFGRAKGTKDDNEWSTPEEKAEDWSGLSCALMLARGPDAKGRVAKMFGFTLNRLPRDMSRLQTEIVATDCRLYIAYCDTANKIVFEGAVHGQS